MEPHTLTISYPRQALDHSPPTSDSHVPGTTGVHQNTQLVVLRYGLPDFCQADFELWSSSLPPKQLRLQLRSTFVDVLPHLALIILILHKHTYSYN
jgi:hypothetical protein